MKRFRPLIYFTLLAFCFAGVCTPSALNAQSTPNPEEPPIISLWDGESRFTVLIAGIDRRPTERETLKVRTDALILASIDPANRQIGLLHIPRDLFFALPPTPDGQALPLVRVNTLLLRGEEIQEGAGAYYLMDTLQYNFGMYIDAYVLFDFQGFVDLIDAIGGIEITTHYNISDPTYPDMDYGYDPFFLSAGTHTLSGADALKFARTRHGDNDYVRGVRQLQVVKAVAERVTSPEILPSLLIRMPAILESLQGNLYTDLTLNDGITLAAFAANLSADDIHTAALNEAYITYTVNQGDSVAIPDREKLSTLLAEAFGENYGE